VGRQICTAGAGGALLRKRATTKGRCPQSQKENPHGWASGLEICSTRDRAEEVTVEYLQVLLATAEEMLATASTLPESADRDDALQMVRAHVSNIALFMTAIELGLKAKRNS